MKSGFVSTAEGRIHYLYGGAGAPLILLHSVGCSAHEYEDVLDRLGESFTVYAWDMPGHGDSSPLIRHYSIEDFAEAVARFMDALGIDRATVLGESIGGPICAALALRHPQRLESLIFCESPLRSAETWAQNWFMVERNFGIPTQTEAQVAQRVRSVSPEFLLRWNIDRNKASAKAMMDAMWAIREFDMFAALPRVTARSLILYGEHGPTVAQAQDFARLLKDAQLVILKDCGHFPMNDDPERFAGVVTDFVHQRAVA